MKGAITGTFAGGWTGESVSGTGGAMSPPLDEGGVTESESGATLCGDAALEGALEDALEVALELLEDGVGFFRAASDDVAKSATTRKKTLRTQVERIGLRLPAEAPAPGVGAKTVKP